MRTFLALAALLAGLAPVAAEPWRQHDLLAFENTPLTLDPNEGVAGDLTTKGFFEALDQAGFSCDARDRPSRRIVVTCTRNGQAPRKIVYSGAFIGAGYLGFQRITLDGKVLPKAAHGSHLEQMMGR